MEFLKIKLYCSRTLTYLLILFLKFKIMSETKTTYIMPDQAGFGGNDLATLALLGGGAGGFGGGMWNNPFMYLIWMYMMRWMNGGEFGGDASTQRQIQTLAD
jgi:hypothetical protein